MNEQGDMNRLMSALASFLNAQPAAISAQDVDELSKTCDVSRETAYALLLASYMGLDIAGSPADRRLYETVFSHMVHVLDASSYSADPYYSNICLPEAIRGAWEFRRLSYKPFEAFVCDDISALDCGLHVPQIGYFTREFHYPAVLERGREWMTVTPNEINTMKRAVGAARGRVLTYGLGLGYYAYMAARKAEVSSVAVVERDDTVIELFTRYILPQIPFSDKISIIRADAFEYAQNGAKDGGYDLIFTDIWHDAGDGVELYLKMKALEGLCPGARHEYWIEPTLKCYI